MEFEITTLFADGREWKWTGTGQQADSYLSRALIDAQLNRHDPDLSPMVGITIIPVEE